MKRVVTLLATVLTAAGLIALTSCTTSDFSFSGESEKLLKVNAKNASAGTESTLGGLDVEEGERILITSELESGTVRIEVYAGPEEQSADELPEPEGDPVMTFDAAGTESMSGTVDAGYYFVRASVTEKATGTVDIEAGSAQ